MEVNDNETETHQFEEDGELIQMEINDGGAAAAEFASESSGSESDSDEELDQNPSRDEQTEDTEAQTSDGNSDSEMRQEPGTSATDKSGVKEKWPIKVKSQRKSVEEKLDNLNNTLEVMKEFFLNSGMVGQPSTSQEKPKRNQGGGDRGNMTCIPTNSDTTIYNNVLNQVGEDESEDVDPEITFKQTEISGNDNRLRESSSSEDRIDTSDELMDVDVDVHDKFIADCEMEANQKRSLQAEANR